MENKLLRSEYVDHNTSEKGINYVLIIATIASMSIILYFSIFDYHNFSLILGVTSFSYFAILLILSHRGLNAYILRLLLISFINFVVFPLGWLSSAGSSGPMLFYSASFLYISTIQARNKHEYVFSALFIVQVILLWRFESYFIPILGHYFQDSIIQIPILVHYITASLIFITLSISNQFSFNQIKRRLKECYMYDELTGLYSRRYVNEIIQKLLLDCQNKENLFSLYLIDIDNFKSVNDVYGHDKGDEILKRLGSIIKENLGYFGIAARYGGDEFILLLCGLNSETHSSIIGRIRSQFNAYVSRYSQVTLGLSIGKNTTLYTSTDQLMRDADQHMYEDKMRKRDLK